MDSDDQRAAAADAASTAGADSGTEHAGAADTASGDSAERVGAGDPVDEAAPTRVTPTPFPRAEPVALAGGTAHTSHRRPRRSPLRIVVRTLVALLSVVALAATGYAYATLDELQDSIQTTDALEANFGDDGSGDTPPPPKDDGAQDILLVGADARTDMQGNALPLAVLKELRTENKDGINTDTIIILRIPKNGGQPSAISIPRDTWVDMPRGGKSKINSAYGTAKAAAADRLRAEGMSDSAEVERESNQVGRGALVATVQDFTRVRIDHYAEVNLLGFYLLTEALGGVDVCLNQATEDKDSGADFEAGPQVVSGGEALSFVRQRKNLPRGDLDRIVRQQTFLASALHKVLSAGTLADPGKLSKLTETVRRSLVLDPDLDLLQLAQQAKGIANGEIDFRTIPVEQIGARSADDQSIVTVNVSKVRQFIAGTVNGNGTTPGSGSGGGGGAAAAGDVTPRAVPQGGVACVN